MNKGTRTILTIIGATGVLAGGLAFAGEHYTGGAVSIYGSGLRANGSLGAVRNSANAVEYLGCKVSASSTAAPVATCSAKDSAGATFYCQTSNTGMVTVALSLSGDSFVTLNRDTAGNCTLITVDNSSLYSPKAP